MIAFMNMPGYEYICIYVYTHTHEKNYVIIGVIMCHLRYVSMYARYKYIQDQLCQI